MTAKKIQEEAARYLSRYAAAKAEVGDIERRIERARAEMMGAKGICYENGDMPKAQFRTGDLSDYIVRMDDLLQDWKAAQDRAIATMREISAAIESVDHDHARRVLMLHFVDGYAYEEIAGMVPCDISTVYRWKSTGLRKVASKCKVMQGNAIKCEK